MPCNECFLILGGAGLVGKQIARRIATDTSFTPRKIVIASLYKAEVEKTLAELQKLPTSSAIEWAGEYGNIFVRSEYATEHLRHLLADPLHRKDLFADLYESIEDSYERSHLVHIIRQHKPDVILDSINTATAISYQNVYVASSKAKQQIEELSTALGAATLARSCSATRTAPKDWGAT